MSVYANREASGAHERLASAAGAVALLLAVNKPVYPLYMLFFARSAFEISLFTALSLPLYLEVWYLARSGQSFAARGGIVVVGMIDTILIAFLLGGESGALYFLFACIMLAGLMFYDHEIWISRAFIAVNFIAFLGLEGRIGEPAASVTPDDMRTLYFINISGVAALLAFIALRVPRLEKAT